MQGLFAGENSGFFRLDVDLDAGAQEPERAAAHGKAEDALERAGVSAQLTPIALGALRRLRRRNAVGFVVSTVTPPSSIKKQSTTP